VVEKVNLQQHFCEHWRALTLRRYPVKFDVDGNRVITCSSAENNICGVQQEVMNQQLTLVGI